MAQDTDAERRLTHNAAQWLERAELGGKTDRFALKDWLKQDAKHVRALLEMYAIREEARRAVRGSRLTERTRHARKVICFPRGPGSPHTSISSADGAGHTRLVALVAVLAVFGVVVLFSRFVGGTRYETAPGERLTVQLRDGSQVRLNSGTKIRVRFGAGERAIELTEGEALFDVAHDARRPLRVRSGSALIQALGTQFDVRQRANELEVFVTSGRVAFSTGNQEVEARPQLTLSAGQALRLRNGLRRDVVEVRALSTPKALQILDWSEGRIALAGTPLREAVELFNRYNKTQLDIDDEDLAQFKLGGTFRLSSPEDFAAVLKSFDIGVRADPQRNGTLHLYRLRRAAEQDRVSMPFSRGVP